MLVTSFSNNPNIGVIGVANDELFIIGQGYSYNRVSIMKELSVDTVIELSVNNTNTPGLFLKWSGDKFFVPNIIRDEELDVLKSYGVKFEIIETRLNALNNNLLILNGKVFCNPDYGRERGWTPLTIGGSKLVGVNVAHNSERAIVNPDASSEEIGLIESQGLVVGVGTVNGGVKFVRSGLVVNNNGLLVGSNTTGPELQRLSEIFITKF